MDKKLDITNLINNNSNEKEPTYWRSFGELYNDPDFINASQREFGEEVTKDFSFKGLSPFSRRKFLALLGASAAFAAAGCSNYKDKGEIIPYNRKPEEIIPGIPNYYASTCTGCSNACGILVKTREGRPIKIDGNPDHPVNKGKICPIGQASILNLYDPGRLKEPQFNTGGGNLQNTSWENADGKIMEALKNASGSGKEIAIISHTINSPTQKLLFEEFIKTFPTTRIYSYEYAGDRNKVSAWEKAYGTRSIPTPKLNEAKVIVSLECDFLGTEGNFPENTRMFAESKDAVESNKNFSRLYVIEGSYSLTGANSDHRIRLRPDAIEEFALALMNELSGKGAFTGDSEVNSAVSSHNLNDFVKKYNLNANIVAELINDISSNKGSVIFLGGNKLSEAAHNAVIMLNEFSSASNLFMQDNISFEVMPLSKKEELEALTGNMNAGNVGVLINFASNPVYHLPYDYGFKDALTKVPLVVSMNEMVNETTDLSTYVLPINHMLESWGDFKTRQGLYSLQQPVIAPIFNTRQKETILLSWIRNGFNDRIYHEYIKKTWETAMYPAAGSMLGYNQYWNTGLHDGVVKIAENTNTVTAATMMATTQFFTQSAAKNPAGINDYCLVINQTVNLGDGSYANNGWLQELPHPISKIVWDNYAAVSPGSAAELGVNNNDLIEIDVDGRKVTLPVYIQAGLADKTIETQLGYGRRKTGQVGMNVGVDVTPLLSKNFLISDRMYGNAKVSKVPGTYELVTTQEHYAIDKPILKDIHKRREIIIEHRYDEYKNDPKIIKKELDEDALFSISTEHPYTGVKWGMSIDLNKCTGCGACTIACNVENNIPVVGKEQVQLGREMTWIRIDRYYSGTPEDAQVNLMPMTCQHCDNAPCENVCPVVATNHSPDGLNQMVYNRCVGTRYCSNNCPYKVRRFNFYDFRDHLNDGYYTSDLVNMMYNPEVTVRSRGVMEKCTFCIQRIMDERQHAIEENRPIDGDKVTVACQDACPANAIVFGDYRKEGSKIKKYREHDLGYHVIEEINSRPNVTYIANLRNINPEKS